MNYSFYYIEN